MEGKRKWALSVAAAVAVLLALAAIGLAYFRDLAAYKPRLEAAASDALGMEVRIGGTMGLALLPPFGVTMDDVTIRHRDVELLHARSMRLGLRLLPLLRREVRIAEFRLVGPSFDIRRRGTGRIDLERYVDRPVRRTHEALPGALLRVGKVLVSDGVLAYSNAESGRRIAMEDIDVTLRALSLREVGGPDPAGDAAFTGTMDVGRVESGGLAATGLRMGIRGENGIFAFDPVSVTVFGGTATGSLGIDATGEVPAVQARYSVPNLRIEKALEAWSRKAILQGEVAVSGDLSVKADGFPDMIGTLNGEVSLKGENLVLSGVDLDRVLADSGDGGNAELAGVAAVLLVGPLGASLDRGDVFAGASAEGGGRGAVRQLVSDWRITNGVAEARDVALSTPEHRVALHGALDFNDGRFDGLTVALLDAKGCAVVSQEIAGTFRDPAFGRLGSRKPHRRPALPPLEEATRTAAAEDCTAFYMGSVTPPPGSESGGP